jgi:hypothetical protein
VDSAIVQQPTVRTLHHRFARDLLSTSENLSAVREAPSHRNIATTATGRKTLAKASGQNIRNIILGPRRSRDIIASTGVVRIMQYCARDFDTTVGQVAVARANRDSADST